VTPPPDFTENSDLELEGLTKAKASELENNWKCTKREKKRKKEKGTTTKKQNKKRTVACVSNTPRQNEHATDKQEHQHKHCQVETKIEKEQDTICWRIWFIKAWVEPRFQMTPPEQQNANHTVSFHKK
jgi:hypothetical protein